jgi:glutamate-ammonia-ligase adenylyltransferase
MSLRDTAETSNRARAWLVTSSPDPPSAERYLEAFEQRHPAVAGRLMASAAGLQSLVAVFSTSRFLSEEVLRNPEWMEEAVAAPDLHRVLSQGEMADRLRAVRQAEGSAPIALALAGFRRRQLLRILIRDVLSLATLSEITEEISNLADAILQTAYERIRTELTRRYGTPVCDGRRCGFSVIALGKLGGRELNYSSDIDLMFVYSGSGHTDGQPSISTQEFFKKVANSMTDLLSTYTGGGISYRVDLRLRPDGSHGEVCISVDGARAYYASRARDWELQMLIKARVAAGEEEPGRELLDSVQERIYSSTLDFSAVEAVSATRERISEKLAARRSGPDAGLDVKLARGGIRDIEFLVQCLQRLHGGKEPWVRHGGTLLALSRLSDKGLVSASEFSRLASAYEFLRRLEHLLQVVDDRQTHTLPARRDELEVLARRMPAREMGRSPTADKLLHQLNLHLEEVQELYERVIHSQQPLYYSSPVPSRSDPSPAEAAAFEPQVPTNLIRFLDQKAPSIAQVVAQTPLRHGGGAFEAFLEKVLDSPDHLRMMQEDAALTADIIDIFENSPWFSDELVRRPELLTEVLRARAGVRTDYDKLPDTVDEALDLRRLFRREMLRIQAESICLKTPIFHTLGHTSDLADAVVVAAYRIARDQVVESHPPARSSYVPADQMMTVALGRLGMREFDVGSDADLNFVLPDEDAAEMQFWTRVAERMINLISAYTGEGSMFAVDTRLRPNGREGTLVQTVSAYKDYIAYRAETWEGISYMKSRCIAGNPELSTRFLHEIQEVDWRRYGQSGRSRADLREMRARLEREQGENNPLKAGPGGYYDIDFALMYLRLRSAGIFFKVLNTPERIDIIEKMGHLEREDAAFLQDAATLYRAIDHGLRIYSGHAEGRLPQSPSQLETLTALVRRWTPEHLHGQPLPDQLAQIQSATRAFFRRLFG